MSASSPCSQYAYPKHQISEANGFAPHDQRCSDLADRFMDDDSDADTAGSNAATSAATPAAPLAAPSTRTVPADSQLVSTDLQSVQSLQRIVATSSFVVDTPAKAADVSVFNAVFSLALSAKFVEFVARVRDNRVFIIDHLMPLSTPFDEMLKSGLAATASMLAHYDGFPQTFKFGVCHDIHARFYNPKYGYIHHGYVQVAVLGQGSPFVCGELEAELIARFARYPGLQNRNPGRESLPRQPPAFVYVVFCAEIHRWQPQLDAKKRRG